MFEELNQHRAAVAENIQKACEIGFTGNELEKAHKVGDVHPNGKWVWTQLPSGRYDWRVIKKTGAPSGGSAPAAAQKTAHSGEDLISKVPGLKNLKEYLTTFNSKYTDFDKVSLSKTPKGNWDVRYDGHRLGIMNGDQISESVVKKMGFHLSKEEKEKMREDSFAREKEKREKLAKELDKKKQSSKSEKKAKVPSGHRIQYEDDLVEVYDDKGKKVYSGLFDYCDYKDENYKWNETDKNYDLPHGYKLVGKTKH